MVRRPRVTPEDLSAEDALFRKVAWRILPFALACFVAAQIDRINVGFAKLTMLDALGMSQTAYGIGAGVFFIGYFLFEVPSNLILERVGPRRWIARIMVSWALLSAATAFVTSANAFYALRFLLGMAEAGFFPALMIYLARWFPARRRAGAIAIVMLGLPLTGVLGGPVSGLILTRLDGAGGLAGWQWLFLIEAVPAFLLGLAATRRLDDRIAAAAWLSPDERAALLRANASAEPLPPADVAAVLRQPTVWRLGLVYFAIGAINYGLAFWLPTMLAHAGAGGSLTIGLLSAIPSLFAIAAILSVARWSDRSGRRVLPFAVCAALAASALFASAIGDISFPVQMAVFVVAVAGGSALPPLFWAIATTTLDRRALIVGTAAINALANLAGFVGPYWLGWSADRSGSALPGLGALGLLLVAATPLLFVTRRAAPVVAARDAG